MKAHRLLLWSSATLPLLALLAAPATAAAQEPTPAPAPGEGGEGGPSGPGVTVVQLPPAAPPPQVVIPGYPAPGTNVDAHLPSSSRSSTDTSRANDTFDLNVPGAGPTSVRGSASGSYVVEGQYVPDTHTVRRGDTLWDISARYYQNPYNWPRVWAYNPQVQNPHWIYPGDHVRLREPGSAPGGQIGGGFGFSRRRAVVPPQTVFLRDYGWIDDKDEDTWGELVGSPDDQMLLTDVNEVYVKLDDRHDVTIGQELTVFLPLRAVDHGQLVSIRGTARVDRYNPKTHMVRAQIVEALDVIERGAKVGPVGRRFDVVAPVENQVDLEATIVASIYPHQFYGQNQLVFVDKGDQEGVKPGNRFFAVFRDDRWASQIRNAGSMARKRPRVEDDRPARVDDINLGGDSEQYPDETYAELRVLRVRDHACTALVTASTHEVERGARLVMRKGY